MVKNPPVNAGDIRDAGPIPGSERCPGGGQGNPFQYSCLENPMNRGAWWATVHGVAKSRTQLKRLNNIHSVPLECKFLEVEIFICFVCWATQVPTVDTQ